MLLRTVETLLRLASLPYNQESDQKQDLVQVHALNILKAVFSDASLVASLISSFTKVLLIIFDGFESPSWAIRNAATQLFDDLDVFNYNIDRLKRNSCHCLQNESVNISTEISASILSLIFTLSVTVAVVQHFDVTINSLEWLLKLTHRDLTDTESKYIHARKLNLREISVISLKVLNLFYKRTSTKCKEVIRIYSCLFDIF